LSAIRSFKKSQKERRLQQSTTQSRWHKKAENNIPIADDVNAINIRSAAQAARAGGSEGRRDAKKMQGACPVVSSLRPCGGEMWIWIQKFCNLCQKEQQQNSEELESQ